MFKAEWKEVFNNKILMLMMIVIPLVPIIYSGIILSAYWDPFGNTSNLPVAVVNLDEPSELDEVALHVGDELVANLKENNDLDWHFVDEKAAQDGFKNGDFYMVITIPDNFSKNASTVLEDEPQKMDLTYVVDPGRNFFSVTISEQAMNQINQEISRSLTKEYTRAIFSQIDEIAEGFAEAADGADEINKGVEDLSDGNKEMTSNLNKLSESTLTLKNGADSIQSGVENFTDGVNTLNTGAADLNNGIIEYTNGVSQLQEKMAPLSDITIINEDLDDGLGHLQEGSKNLKSGLEEVQRKLPSNNEVNQLTQGLKDIQLAVNDLEKNNQSEMSEELIEQIEALNKVVNQIQPQAIEAIGEYKNINQVLSSDEGLINGSSKITDGIESAISEKENLINTATKLTEGLPQLVQAIDKLDSSSNELREGSASLATGTEEMVNQLPELNSGISELSEGAGELNEGAVKLAEGSSILDEGIGTLEDGTSELAEGLSEASETVSSIVATDENYDMLASPITLVEEKTSTVPNYGHALAPMFISLGLYIGALAFNLIYPLTKASIKPTSGLSWWFSKFSLGVVPAVAGAVILSVIVVYGMGLEVASVGKFLSISILGSLTYMFFMMLLVIVMGNPGRFIAMILLVLQLASSGGMFPAILQNSFFEAINPYMPMTYVIYGLREAMTASLGNGTFYFSIVFLIACIVLFNGFIWLYYYVINKRNHKLAEEH